MLDPNTLLLVAALAVPHDSAARAPSANDSVLASVVAPLIAPGTPLRVRSGFGITEGIAGSVGPLGVQLRHEVASGWSRPYGASIAWSEIERIELRTRSAGNGARVGAAFGCLLGLATVMSAASYTGPYGGSGPGGGELLFAGVVGGLAGGCVGALTGGLIGSLMPSWRTVYEHR